MTSTYARTAVVSGAGSGIGRALATALARRGCRLAISDVEAGGLAATAEGCRQLGAEVLEEIVDVRDADAVGSHATATVERFGAVHLVFNNAGVAAYGGVEDQTYEDIAHVLDVNLWGVIHGTREFLPHLRASEGGHLVNISSLFGLIGVPAHSAYIASKFAVRGWTEALAVELAAEGSSVGVSCVHPGGIATGIARAALILGEHDPQALHRLFDALAITSPDQAATAILRGVERNRRRILVGRDAKVMGNAARLLGSYYQPIAARYAGKLLHPRPGHHVRAGDRDEPNGRQRAG